MHNIFKTLCNQLVSSEEKVHLFFFLSPKLIFKFHCQSVLCSFQQVKERTFTFNAFCSKKKKKLGKKQFRCVLLFIKRSRFYLGNLAIGRNLEITLKNFIQRVLNLTELIENFGLSLTQTKLTKFQFLIGGVIIQEKFLKEKQLASRPGGFVRCNYSYGEHSDSERMVRPS